MMDILTQWATLLSPIISVIAIIVALCIARSSSKDTQKQIDAIHNLLDVFVAANNLDIVETQRKYQFQLTELNKRIKDAKEDIETVHYPFLGRGARIDDIEAILLQPRALRIVSVWRVPAGYGIHLLRAEHNR